MARWFQHTWKSVRRSKLWRGLVELFRTEGQRQLGNPDGHYLKQRYGIEAKPPGWNDAVLGFFHRGPERRQPSEDFRSAFHERAKVPPPSKECAG